MTVLRVHHWLSEVALPFWAHVGVDREEGGFVERLMLDGTPDETAPKRMRVQARQIYVFSHAATLGMMDGALQIATHGYHFVMRHAFPDGLARGAVHSVSRDGMIVDARRDTYDHAFLLFALSWYYRASKRLDVRETLMALGDTIWNVLRHPGQFGFVVDDTGGDALHQNPHMHLFEAVLAAHEATGEPIFLHRARELFNLFRTRMFDRKAGVIREFHDAQWQPAAGSAGRIVEPGHHCEWIWLLKWYADRAGEPLCDEAFALYAFVARHGRARSDVLLCDEVEPDGRVRKASTRSWPQTEALKAEVALANARKEALGACGEAIVEALFDHFLDQPVVGAWIDWIDESGNPLVKSIPASTFYHVFLAFTEYLRAREK